MLAVTICATKSYTYAMLSQANRVAINLRNGWRDKFVIILSGDKSSQLEAVRRKYVELLGPESIVLLNAGSENSGDNYKEEAQRLIARLRDAAFTEARRLGATFCWSLDSDTLPPHNALRCMVNTLEFDDGYYSVATCPYPNTAFLGGFGTPHNHIAEDFLPHERQLPDQLKAELKANEAEGKRLFEEKKEVPPEMRQKWDATNKKIKECPPDGNIWQVIAKHGWRRRGWLDNAYPAIGLGAVVPSDWCGFGCTLLNKQALDLAYFDGYEGKGTEDLFICWKRWHPAGLKLNVIPHCPCDHVIWEKKKGGDKAKYTLLHVYHEEVGECRGHLRQRPIPWVPELLDPKTS